MSPDDFQNRHSIPRVVDRQRAQVIPPKTYILARRLEAAKRELRSGIMTTVADVSDNYVFSHPSRFAEHYKRQFGELPSSAKRRNLIMRMDKLSGASALRSD